MTSERTMDAGAGNESIVAKVERYFYEDDSFARIFEDFAKRNASRIDLSTNECTFEYTEMYKDFQRLFEDALSDYIVAQGSTTKQFYSEVREAVVRDDKSDTAVFAQILLAVCDFDVFLQVMRETARQHREQEMSDEGGSHK